MKIKYSFSFKNIILLFVIVFFTLLLLNSLFSGSSEGFCSDIPPPIDDSIKVYPNLTPASKTTPNVNATKGPQTSTSPSTPAVSTTQTPSSFNPTCSGNGWTDPNPAANGRHFFCDGNGNYLPASGFCPANLQNVNGLCVVPSPTTTSPASSITTPAASITTSPAPFTPNCSGSGWTDPNPASNGRHFNCDGNGNYLPAGGFCPANFQSVNGVCVDPASITTQPTQ